MTDKLTKATADRLGKRIRDTVLTSVENLRVLEEWRRTYEDAMLHAREVLQNLGFAPSFRLKTSAAMVSKLRRQTTKLSQVQDIAGLRIVLDASRSEQDGAVDRIATVLRARRIDDRRSRPSHGYRAVHVIAEVSGRVVEVQVRTILQDRWAQFVEYLEGSLGREIHYGQPPLNADDHVFGRPDFPTAGAAYALLGTLADTIDSHEAAVAGSDNSLSGLVTGQPPALRLLVEEFERSLR